jgi:hypothetical protein
MAMVVGDARLGTGLAGAIASAMKDENDRYDVNKAGGDLLPNAIAKAVVDYLKSNADVNGVVVNTTTGVQVGVGGLI